MAKKPSITTVASGYQSTTTINNNLQNLRDAFDNTISRDGSAPNEMLADLDMNSNDILNVNSISVEELIIDNLNLSTVVQQTAANAAAAAASYDSFDDRYLGAKATAPTLDNDGNALITGALYWNTTSSQMFVRSGASWINYEATSIASAATATTQAGIATTQATTATGQAIAATSAKTAAEAARDAAQLAGDIYASTAAGLAAKTVGQYFSVPAAGSTEFLILYRVDAGPVATEIKRYPSASAVSSVAALVETNATPNNVHVAVIDPQSNVLSYIGVDGQAFINGESNSLQSIIADNRRKRYAAAVLPMQFVSASNTMQRDLIYQASLQADTLLEPEEFLVTRAILTEAYLQNEGYRIATLAKIAENQILLICQNTRVPNITTDVQNSQLVGIDLTYDPVSRTLSTSNERVILSYRSIPDPLVANQTAFVANPTALKIRGGTNKGRIYLFHGTNKDAPSTDIQRPMIMHSDDNGATWSTPVYATAFESFISSIGTGYGGSFTSGPQGIQLQYHSTKGRLLVPAYVYSSSGATQRFVCMYSDNGGSTWAMGSLAPSDSNETAIAEDVDGTIYASVRRSDSGVYARDLLKSADGGVTWTLVQASYLTDSQCNASMLQASASASASPKLFTCNANAPTYRGDLKVRISYGVPNQFNGTYQIDSFFAGYSAMEMLNEQDVLLVYEKREAYLQSDGTPYWSSSLTSIRGVVFNANKVR